MPDDLNKHVSLRDYPDALKPRERLQQVGPAALSNTELVAILLGTGSERLTALDLAQQLLRALPEGDLAQLGQLNLRQLTQLNGLGPAKATRLLAALELGRRVSRAELPERPVLNSPEVVFQLLQPRLGHQQQEHFVALFVDTKKCLVAQQVITLGLLDGTLVHPREIFREALACGAHAFVVAHNHPSGDPTPSREDRETTRQLVRCGTLMQIPLLDHVVLGRARYYSLREQEAWLWNNNDTLE